MPIVMARRFAVANRSAITGIRHGTNAGQSGKIADAYNVAKY